MRFEREIAAAAKEMQLAADRNAHKPHYMQESIPFLLDKQKEEGKELDRAILSGDETRIREELGDYNLTNTLIVARLGALIKLAAVDSIDAAAAAAEPLAQDEAMRRIQELEQALEDALRMAKRSEGALKQLGYHRTAAVVDSQLERSRRVLDRDSKAEGMVN